MFHTGSVKHLAFSPSSLSRPLNRNLGQICTGIPLFFAVIPAHKAEIRLKSRHPQKTTAPRRNGCFNLLYRSFLFNFFRVASSAF